MVLQLDSQLVPKKVWMMDNRMEQMLVPRLGSEKVRNLVVMKFDWWTELQMVLRLKSQLVLK